MSFRCAVCKKIVGKGTKEIKAVVATRGKYYPDGGYGIEIVKEVKVCSNECLPTTQPSFTPAKDRPKIIEKPRYEYQQEETKPFKPERKRR